MINIYDYIKSTINLVNSLTIKFNDEAVFTNMIVEKTLNIKIDDPNEWKYYKNMNGEYTNIDIPIITYIPDIDKTDVITKDNIKKYPILKNELLKFDKTFNNLVENYPSQALLIRGILNPISPEISLPAKNGTILYYRKDLVQENEINLISDIETFINNFFTRYHVKDYTIDELYLSAMLSNLYSLLPGFIIARRISYVLTNSVDRFHLLNHLYTLKKLDPTGLLDLTTQIWLYGNLNDIKTNVGHNRILNYLINKILDYNNIGVGNLHIGKLKPKLIEENIYKPNKSILDLDNKHSVYMMPLNSNYVKEDDNKATIENILETEKDLGLISENINLKHLADVYKKRLISINENDSPTKVLYIDRKDLGTFYQDSLIVMAWFNLIYYLKKKNIYIGMNFIDPYTMKLIKLDNEKLFYLIIYYMLYISDINLTGELKLSSYLFDMVYKSPNDINDLVKDLMYEKQLLPFVKELVNTLDNVCNFNQITKFKEYISTMAVSISYMWYLITNVNDNMLSADLKLLFNRLFTRGKIVEDIPYDLNKFIDNLGLSRKITSEFAYAGLRTLFKDVIGIPVREIDTIIDKLKAYIKLSNKFKSYTLQFVFDTQLLDIQKTYSTSLQMGNTNKGIVTVQYGHYRYYIPTRIWEHYYQLPNGNITTNDYNKMDNFKTVEKTYINYKHTDILVNCENFMSRHYGILLNTINTKSSAYTSKTTITTVDSKTINEISVKRPILRYNIKDMQTYLDEEFELNAVYANYKTEKTMTYNKKEKLTNDIILNPDIETYIEPKIKSGNSEITTLNSVTNNKKSDPDNTSSNINSKTDNILNTDNNDKETIALVDSNTVAQEDNIITVPTNTMYTVDPD